MGNSELSSPHSLNQSSSDSSHFDYSPYIREGISLEDVKHIKQAFDNLRDENDRPNEVKLSKLKMFPFFTKQDLAKLPRESERIKNQFKEDAYSQSANNDVLAHRNNGNYIEDQNSHIDSSQQLKIYNAQNSIQRGQLRMEGKGIDCQSIMCNCNNARTINNQQLLSIRDTSVTFDQFYEIMSEKIQDSQQHSNIIFESKVSNVSCFLWPLFGTQ